MMQLAILEKIEDHQQTYDAIVPQRPHAEYDEFLKKRSTPDVIVIGRQGHILFVSHGESSVLKLLENKEKTAEEHEARLQLTHILNRLQITVSSQIDRIDFNADQDANKAFFSFREHTVSLRGQGLKGDAGTSDFVMILIEPLHPGTRSAVLAQSRPKFTPREEAVLHYVKKGFTNKAIAEVLNIGVHTVKDHVKRIMKKVNAHTRAGIVGKLEERPLTQGHV
ncbi:MAG: LuxR C-terminal-related transcriptional regulator [Nitrospirota bacterium]|nr:LuxR C-terminal-related transcriptional regulator [Nitrospirota bacterium]